MWIKVLNALNTILMISEDIVLGVIEMVISIGFQIGFVTCFEIYDQAMMIITFTNNGNLSLNKSDVLMTHYKSDIIILNQVIPIR
jgi:hypothetical protein